jgi:3-oxoacyl-[acyl-carrier-protein] synthase-3
LAAIAGKRAIDNAGLRNSDIELIIVATATPDRKAPSTAAFVQHKLQAFNAAAFDLAAVCSGFLFGMSVATQYIASGVYNNVLVIGADTFRKITDWTKRDAVFFGDGAGAAVVTHASILKVFLHIFYILIVSSDMLGFTVPGGGSENPLHEKISMISISV